MPPSEERKAHGMPGERQAAPGSRPPESRPAAPGWWSGIVVPVWLVLWGQAERPPGYAAPAPPPVARAPRPTGATPDLWSLAILICSIIAAVILLIVVWRAVRRWMDTSPTRDPSTRFTLADLRRLRDQQLLTDEEYQRARQSVVKHEMEGERAKDDGRDEAAEEEDGQNA
jgi:hypothetical protein